jgi:uncharacterized linocin/CFP29 family protein
MASAMIMFRRAADVIARVEDAIIFQGQSNVSNGLTDVKEVYSISGGGDSKGLLDYMTSKNTVSAKISDETASGGALLGAVVDAITKLESTGHLGPFACVLGRDLFLASVRPNSSSMVLPRDSILPFLNGPILRTSTLAPNQGVIVSLQGEPVEIVVPKDISVRFLQTTLDNLHVFRVSQRFVLRVKEPEALAFFSAT